MGKGRRTQGASQRNKKKRVCQDCGEILDPFHVCPDLTRRDDFGYEEDIPVTIPESGADKRLRQGSALIEQGEDDPADRNEGVEDLR